MNTETKPLVSIITPGYNSIDYIKECIESVLAQTYPNVEHIIQDGASTDGTVEILKEYANRYPDKIFINSEPDKGQSDGLNKAIQRSKGDILLVLNTDDALLPHACAWAAENMARYPDVAVIYGDEYIMDKNSRIIEEFIAGEYDFKKLICCELVPPAQAAFIRRSHFKQVGFYADKNLDTCPDFEMWARIGLKFTMKKVPGFISKYRRFHGPVLESKQLKTARRMFDAKKLVMDRVFDDPQTSQSIRDLRLEAYSGLVIWTAITELIFTDKKHNLFHFLKNSYDYQKLVPTKFRYKVRTTFILGTLYMKKIIRAKLKRVLIYVPKPIILAFIKIPGPKKWKSLIIEVINNQ